MNMTPKEIQAAAMALQAEIGGQCAVYSSISRFSGNPIEISVYVEGICHNRTFSIEAAEWDEAFVLARAKWEEVKERSAAGKIERMALEIIRVTAIKGQCQGADLRTARFDQADIERYGSMACAKADAMANNGPFSIAPEAKENAA